MRYTLLMDSRRAKNIVITSCVLIILVFLFFLFFTKKSAQTPHGLPSENPFSSSTTGVIFPGNGSNNGQIATSSNVNISPVVAEAVSKCNSSILAERNDCIKKTAIQNKSPALCGAILGTLGQTDCKNSVIKGEEQPVNAFSQAVANHNFAPITKITATSSPVIAQFTDILQKAGDAVRYANEHPDPKFTAAGFYDRLRSGTPKLFSFSDYQIKPGAATTANGFGFTKTGNDIHIGGFTVPNLDSPSGATIDFTIPGSISEGIYQIWVTNANGSSKNDTQKIQIIITNNPAPRPTITGISPVLPTLDDTVTLTGQSLSNAVGVFTSLGVIKKVSSDAGSITFKISDFELVDKIKNLPNIKGKKITVSVIVGTPQGYNKDMFNFDVQF